MRFITMGLEERPTLLFIHGLSATAESCYGTVGRLLQNNWHIVFCELDGHYEGSPAFTNIDAECEQIETYVLEKHAGRPPCPISSNTLKTVCGRFFLI